MHAITAQAASHTESGLPADAAAKVIAKAVTARKPRTRYTVGRDAALITLLARFLPDRTLDRVLAAALRPHFAKESRLSTTTLIPLAGKTALVRKKRKMFDFLCACERQAIPFDPCTIRLCPQSTGGCAGRGGTCHDNSAIKGECSDNWNGKVGMTRLFGFFCGYDREILRTALWRLKAE